VGQLEARVALQSIFRSSPYAKNIRRPLQAIRWCDLEVGAGKGGGFGIPRGIDERLHGDFHSAISRTQVHGLDLAGGGFHSREIRVKKNDQVWRSAREVIRHGGKGCGIMGKNVELSHSHG
jgi:hypothetical protein